MADIIKRTRTGPPDGHPRYGGRRPGSVNRKTAEMRDLAAQLGVDPVEYLCTIIACDYAVQAPVVDPDTGKQLIGADGKPLLKWMAITTRQKIDACKELLPYVKPRLAATQVTGPDDAPLQVATLDITQILADPELARNAQALALRVIEQQGDADGAGEPVPSDFYSRRS